MKSAKLTFIKLELLISTHNCFKDIVFWSQPKIGLNNCWKWKLFWWYRNGYKVENSIWAKFGQSSFSQVLSPLNILGILQAIKVFDKSNFSEVLFPIKGKSSVVKPAIANTAITLNKKNLLIVFIILSAEVMDLFFTSFDAHMQKIIL